MLRLGTFLALFVLVLLMPLLHAQEKTIKVPVALRLSADRPEVSVGEEVELQVVCEGTGVSKFTGYGFNKYRAGAFDKETGGILSFRPKNYVLDDKLFEPLANLIVYGEPEEIGKVKSGKVGQVFKFKPDARIKK